MADPESRNYDRAMTAVTVATPEDPRSAATRREDGLVTTVADSASPRTKVLVDSVGLEYQRRRRAATVALQDVAFSIAEGEFVSVVGPSGCGKSSLLRILAGIRRPSCGRVEIQHKNPASPLSATVFQEYSIFPWLSVQSNISLGLIAAGMSRSDAIQQANDWISTVGLTGFGDAYPSALSGGMRQRVALARAFALEPELLLMDEPFAALDAQMRKILQDELLRICQQHSHTVLFVTHNLDEALLLSDRIILMTALPGRIKAVYDVPFAHPRTSDLRADPAFTKLEARIWEDLRVEVERGRSEADLDK